MRTGAAFVLFDEVQTYLDLLARRDPGQAHTDLGHLDRLHSHLGQHPLSPDRLDHVASSRAFRGRRIVTRLAPDETRSAGRGRGGRSVRRRLLAACADDAVAEGVRLAGGYPRWIKRLAQSMTGPPEQLLGLSHLDTAMERLFDTAPVPERTLAHLTRHGSDVHLQLALRLASEPGANRVTLLAGLQQAGLSRPGAEQILAILRDEFYLDDAGDFTLPLLAEWLREARVRLDPFTPVARRPPPPIEARTVALDESTRVAGGCLRGLPRGKAGDLVLDRRPAWRRQVSPAAPGPLEAERTERRAMGRRGHGGR